MGDKKISSTRPKITKNDIALANIDLEKTKLRYKHQEKILQANKQFETMRNQQINDQEKIYLDQKESDRKRILDGYKHSEEMMRNEVENNKNKLDAFVHCFEKYLDMVTKLLPTLEEKRSENLKLLMQYNDEVREAYEDDIKRVDESIENKQKELKEETNKYSVNSYYINESINKLEKTKEELLSEKFSFIKESTLKLDGYMTNELSITNPFNISNLGSIYELIGNSENLLIEGKQ